MSTVTPQRLEVPAASARPAARRRGRVRSAIRALSTVLIVSGTLLMADAALTVAWQEPISALLATISQDHLSHDLSVLEQSGPTPLELRVIHALPNESARVAFLARSLKRRAPEGSAVGRIRIPKIGADFVLVNGTGEGDLQKGPGIYPQTPFPGASGTTAIAGHRTTYLAPFRHIDALRPGNTIDIAMPYATLTYRVQYTKIVLPNALWVIHRTGYDRLVLSACHPLYSASHRIVVFARLVSTRPTAEALRGA